MVLSPLPGRGGRAGDAQGACQRQQRDVRFGQLFLHDVCGADAGCGRPGHGIRHGGAEEQIRLQDV
ncbi:hypothetical protein ES708_30097 [subsurface metagenome]